MSNICSAHQGDVPIEGCHACNTTIQAFIPGFDQLLAEAEAAGRHQCVKCEFVYYRTVDSCPNCGCERDGL